MKKLAIFALSISLMGFAQADVSVYGKARIYEESYTSGSASALTRLTNDSSRIGIKATEDVGSGLKAGFVLETGVGADAPTASTLGDRTTLFTLSSTMGSIGLGRDKHSVTRALDNFDSMENAYGNGVSTIHAAQGSRLQNTIFVTANVGKGITANYQLSNSETANVSNVQAGSIDYSAGPLSTTVAMYDDSISSSSTVAGVKYTVVKTGTTVFGLYSDNKVSGVASTGKSIGVRQAVLPNVAVLGSYGESSSGTSASAVGVAYSMNKALTLHARYAKITTTAEVKQYGAGVEYNF